MVIELLLNELIFPKVGFVLVVLSRTSLINVCQNGSDAAKSKVWSPKTSIVFTKKPAQSTSLNCMEALIL